MKRVLIIGNESDPLCASVAEAVRNRDARPDLLTIENGRCPATITLSNGIEGYPDGIVLEGEEIPVAEINGILNRMPLAPRPGLDATALGDEEVEDPHFAHAELHSLVRFLSYAAPARVINRLNFRLWGSLVVEPHMVARMFPGLEVPVDEVAVSIDESLWDVQAQHPDREAIVYRPFAHPFEQHVLDLWEDSDRLKSWAKYLPIRTTAEGGVPGFDLYIAGSDVHRVTGSAADFPARLVELSRRICEALEIDFARVVWGPRKDGPQPWVLERVDLQCGVPEVLVKEVANSIAQELVA